MVDIQSPTAEIRQGKKKKKERRRRKKKLQDENIMSASATQGSHNESLSCRTRMSDDLNLLMAALRSRCGHYIFALWFLLLSSSSFSFLA